MIKGIDIINIIIMILIHIFYNKNTKKIIINIKYINI